MGIRVNKRSVRKNSKSLRRSSKRNRRSVKRNRNRSRRRSSKRLKSAKVTKFDGKKIDNKKVQQTIHQIAHKQQVHHQISHPKVYNFDIIELMGCPACTKVKNTLKGRYTVVKETNDHKNAISERKYNKGWSGCAKIGKNGKTDVYNCFPKVFLKHKNKLHFIGGNPEVEEFLKLEKDDQAVDNYLLQPYF